MGSVPMRMILVAIGAHYRAYNEYHDWLAGQRALYAAEVAGDA